MATAPKKKTLRWWVLYGVAGIVDLIQIVIDFTGIGIAVSEALELVMPFLIGGILFAFRLLNMQTGISVAIAVVLDALTGGFAPFWVGDIYYIHKQVQSSEAAQIAGQEEAEMVQQGRMPLNAGGVRTPRNIEVSEVAEGAEPRSARNPNTRPLNINGVRQPRR